MKYFFLTLYLLIQLCQCCKNVQIQGNIYALKRLPTIYQQIEYNDQQNNKKNFIFAYSYCSKASKKCIMKSIISSEQYIKNQVINILKSSIYIYYQQNCFLFQIKQNQKADFINKQNKSQGFNITYNSFINQNNQSNNLNIFYHCSNQKQPKILLETIQQDNILVKIYSNSNCPTLVLNSLRPFFQKYLILITIIVIIIGMIFLILGSLLYKLIIILCGIFTIWLAHAFIIDSVNQNHKNRIIIVSIISSLFTGYFPYLFPKAGHFLLGAWVGLLLCFLLNNMFMHYWAKNSLPIIITASILSPAFGILIMFLKKSVIIYATCKQFLQAFIGSYFIIRSFSWHLGSFPNQLDIARQIRYGFYEKTPNLYYVYFVAFLWLFANGVCIQKYLFNRHKKKKNFQGDIHDYLNEEQQKMNINRQNGYVKKPFEVLKQQFNWKRKSDKNQEQQLQQPLSSQRNY